MITTADQREIDNFTVLSDQWWDEGGPMAPLHAFTPIRVDYILQTISKFFPIQANKPPSARVSLSGLRVLDLGCGGGLLAEPIARLGATVTGIDVTNAAIQAAKMHSIKMQLAIDYQTIAADNMAASGAVFDVIYSSEVIEHVANRALFIDSIAKMLAPNGVVIITTINRSLPAILLAKFALEYVLRLVPAGTHDPQKFIKPQELRAEFARVNILLDDLTGFAPRLGGGFVNTNSLAINYAASGGFL